MSESENIKFTKSMKIRVKPPVKVLKSLRFQFFFAILLSKL